MIKKITLILLMVIAYPITSQESKFELDCVNTSRPEFRLNYSIMRHMNPTISTGDSVVIGKAAGTSTAYPETISKLFEIPYRKAEAFYAERKFNEAVTIYNISALSYLAEAYYFLKNKEANHFYVCETLKLDKNNKDVLQFLML